MTKDSGLGLSSMTGDMEIDSSERSIYDLRWSSNRTISDRLPCAESTICDPVHAFTIPTSCAFARLGSSVTVTDIFVTRLGRKDAGLVVVVRKNREMLFGELRMIVRYRIWSMNWLIALHTSARAKGLFA